MKKTSKKISVIISTYNRSEYLKIAIESVLNQTYKNVEIIIIDDCSSDNTKEIAQEYQQKSKKIIYYRNKKNLGCGLSRKYALENIATGEYIVFLDDDDKFINNEYFKKAISTFDKNEKLSMVCAPHIVNDVVNNTKTEINFNYKSLVDNKKFFLYFGKEDYRKPIISIAIIKKDALEFSNYHEMKILNDTTIFLRALLYGPMGFIKNTSAEYLVHENNMSFNCKVDFIIDNLNEKYNVYKKIDKSKFKLTQKQKEKWLDEQLDITIVYYIKGSKPDYFKFKKIIRWYKKNIKNKEKLKFYKELYKDTKKHEKQI
jgi:glycosyltransferase involved in cell wall biosynthesis